MPIRRAKPVADLHEAVRDYDRVLVPDAPLASALNRHVDRPRLGDLATTPRRLAAGRRETTEERTVFLELLAETDLTYKQAAYLGEEVIHCWEYTGRPDAILEYDPFDRPAVERVVEHVRTLDTTSRRLTDYGVDPSVDLAVVGHTEMTALERSILPGEFDVVDRFAEGSFDRPPFHVFDTAADVVDAVLSAVDDESADDVAVVLDADGEFSALVESALDAAGVPYFGGPGFLDDPDHRAFLRLLRAGFRGGDVRVEALKPLLEHLGLDVDVEHERKRLQELSSPAARELREWCEAVARGDWTFGEALSAYADLVGADGFGAFAGELATLGVATETVTEPRVDDIEFYLQAYEVPVERENEGVLLADAGSATHVDRPLVVYLGLDDGWTRTPPRRPWVDREAEFERHLREFQLLLQNGTAQYYLVRDAVGGSPVTPCLYFEELLDADVGRFGDLDAARHATPAGDGPDGFEAGSLDVERTRPSTVSQSTLGRYVNSPRDYFFSRLLESPDRDYFRDGNLFHDFAEYYVHHPDAVVLADDADGGGSDPGERGVGGDATGRGQPGAGSDDPFDATGEPFGASDEPFGATGEQHGDGARAVSDVVDVMVAEMAPFVRDVDRAVQRTRYRAGVETLVEYLDEHAPDPASFEVDDPRTRGNDFAEQFDDPVGADVAERWFEDESLGVKGKIDLVASPTRLVDFKSGARKSARDVVKNSALAEPSDTPNFQALLYLTYQRSRQPDDPLAFEFVHFLEPLDDVVAGDPDVEDALTTVPYHPRTYREHVRREATFEHLREHGPGDCRKTLSKAAYADYEAAFEEATLPVTRDSDELVDSAFCGAMTDRMVAAVGDYTYVRNGCEQAMRELVRIRNRGYFADDLDAFEAFVGERLDELDRRLAGEERFPVADLLDEPNYRWVDHRDLLLEDER